MNILHTFTRRALKKNRMRTLVTIIGIVLSMALLTAVIEGAYSGLYYMRSVTEEDAGNWHAYFQNLDTKTAESVKEQDFVRDVVTSWQTVGYEALDPDTDRLPLFVDALLGDAPLIESRILSGRMPENEHELILSSRFFSYARETNLDAFAVGSTVTVSIGSRTNPLGEPLTENDPLWEDEFVTDAKPRTYTVVGVYKSFDPSVDGTGYRALTKGQGTGDCSVFFTVKHPYLFKRVMAEQSVSQDWRPNSTLMRYYFAFGDDTVTTMLCGFAGVLVLLVMFGSISLIYNAFSISVAERTRQFGILKSIGATKKQIRASVRYEALVLSAFGIPIGMLVGCLGIGITLWAIRDTFTALMPNATTQMRLALHPVALLIAAAIALVTVLISAAVPAWRAACLQPIDAIRQSTDIRTKAREVKTSRLTEKLFGFEGAMGAKNFKRNKKGYRATVLSLMMSIVLFIGASSFCTYLTDMVETLTEYTSYDVFAYVPVNAVQDVMEKMRDFEGVTRAAFFFPENVSDGYSAKTALLTDTFLAVPSHTLDAENEQSYVPLEVLWLEDDVFRALCQANGIDPEPYFDPENPYGVLMNSDITESLHLARNKVKRYRYDLFRDDALPASVTTRKIARRDGLVAEYSWDDEAGETRIAYYPEAYWRQVMEGAAETHSYTMDISRAELVLTEEEASETVTYSFDTFVKTDGFCLPQNCASLIYPFARLDASTFDTEKQAQMFFAAKDHKAVREALLEMFEDSDWKFNAYAGDAAQERENSRMIVGVVNVFAYGFIILISLIAAANVFNTISTNIMLRRREFAMLKSIGMTEKGMRKMLSYECVIYGLRALLLGLPVSIGVTFLIHRIVAQELQRGFYVPWHSIAIAVGSVFLVVFATMLYARRKLRNDNPIDALKNENL